MHDHSLGSVTPQDARYYNSIVKARLRVARTVVSRIRESGGAAG
jgi:hypothetical protein